MKKLLFVLSFLLSISTCFSQSTKIPESLSDPKWKDPKKSGFLIANDGTKTEVTFDTPLQYTIREVSYGGVIYTIKGTTKILRSIGDEYKSFQIDDKVFERPNLTLKSGKKIDFMQPLAKGKIDMYMYIHFTNTNIDSDGVSHEGAYYYTSYFLRKNSTKEEFIANEGAGTSKVVPIKGLDLLKMVNDYNAAK
jgi:hypothetical protein